MFINNAYAQTATGTPAGGDFFSLALPFILIFVVMYFLIIRPQSKRMKAHKELIGSLRRGDVVVTSGGLIGKIHRIVDDHDVILELSENLRISHQRQMIVEIRTKTDPLPSEIEEDKKPTKAKKTPVKTTKAKKTDGKKTTRKTQ